MADTEIEVIRQQLASRPRPSGLAERRERLDALGARYALPDDVEVQPIDIDGVSAEWTRTPADEGRVLLFFHGGGYVSGSLASHRHLAAEVGRQAGARTLAVGYRRAPEHPFPAALDDAVRAYRYLLRQGIAPDRIAIGGESAGGGLALATMIVARDAGDPLPACAWLSSPWVDLTNSGATMQTKAAIDPLISKPYLDELAGLYRGNADLSAPLLSPLNAQLQGLPPLLVQVGSSETLLDDAVAVAGVAGAAEVPVTLQIWPEMIHAFTLFYQQLAPGRLALAEVGRFIGSLTAGQTVAPTR